MKTLRWHAFAALAAGLVVLPADAQEQPSTPTPPVPAPSAASSDGGWRHGVLLYMLGAGLSGQTAVRGLEADIDVSFSELMEDLELGGMVAYRGETERWAVMANIVFMGLGGTKDGPANSVFEADLDQWVLEADAAYRFGERFEVLFGARGISLDQTVEVRTGIGTTTAQGSESWADPVVGARVAVPIGKRWSFVARGDVGGFGVASDLTWQAMAHFDWRSSGKIGLTFGYSALDVDYEDGSGADLFRYDVNIQGPMFGLTIHF